MKGEEDRAPGKGWEQERDGEGMRGRGQGAIGRGQGAK